LSKKLRIKSYILIMNINILLFQTFVHATIQLKLALNTKHTINLLFHQGLYIHWRPWFLYHSMFIVKYVAFEQNCFAGSYETFPSINDVISCDHCIYFCLFSNITQKVSSFLR